jgi:hypothetical protein
MADKQTLQQFGASIKAKHPEYKDMDDGAVGKAVLAKYPQYADMVEQAPATPPPSMLQSALSTGGDVLKGIGKGALHTISGTDEWAREHLPAVLTNSNIGFGPPANLGHVKEMATPRGTAQNIGYGGEQVGEFLLPTGVEEGAARLGGEVLGHGGEIAGKLLGSAAHSAGVNKAQGGSATTGALMGAGGTAVGEGMKAAAPLIAESALGVRGADKMYGRTVGNAIMEDTSGVRPSTIEGSARGKIAELKPQLEQAAEDAGASGARGSLLPARQGVDDAIAGHITNRATKTAAELEPLQTHLATDSTTGLPLAQDQTPTGLLQMKRGLDSDFIRNWSPLTGSRPALGQARQAYGNLADEFHASAPGTQNLDQRISSLIPVANRADIMSRAPGVMENTLNRFRVPTGALTGAVGGGAAGYHEGGLPGAVAGAGMGALLPSVISSPTTQMIMARGLYDGVPKLLPAAGGAALQTDRGNQ